MEEVFNVTVHLPYHIGMTIDELFEVGEDKYTVSIRNSKCVILLWKVILMTHTTIL